MIILVIRQDILGDTHDVRATFVQNQFKSVFFTSPAEMTEFDNLNKCWIGYYCEIFRWFRSDKIIDITTNKYIGKENMQGCFKNIPRSKHV